MPKPKPDLRDPEYVAFAHLFNDITAAPTEQFVLFSTRGTIAEHLWELGYRKSVDSEPAMGSRSAEQPSEVVQDPQKGESA